MKTAFTASRLYTPVEEIQNPVLVVEDGRHLRGLFARRNRDAPSNVALVDFGDAVLAPGFVDIHIHGGAGLDVMRASASELPRLGKFLATHGVTGYFPTTVAAPLDSTCAALGRLADAIEGGRPVRPMAIPYRLGLSAFILRDHFSATSDVEYIRQRIWSRQPWTCSSVFGRPRADMCGC